MILFIGHCRTMDVLSSWYSSYIPNSIIYSTAALGLNLLNFDSLLLHFILIISCSSTVGSLSRLYNAKFTLTTIRDMEGRELTTDYLTQELQLHFPSLLRQLRIKNYFRTSVEPLSHIPQSPGTLCDFEESTILSRSLHKVNSTIET